MFGIPFKRLLLAGVGGGMTYTVFNLALAGWSIPIAVVTAILTIVLTSPRGGIPLWNRLVYRLRGTLLLMAVRHPASPIGKITDMLELSTDLVRLDGSRVFAPPGGDVEIDLREWITFVYANESDGLVFVDSPMQDIAHE